MVSLKDRYKACLIVHALGDTIGYKNGDWEFNYNKPVITLIDNYDMLCEFIELGGVNHLDMKGWKVSDDTILHLANVKGFLKESEDLDKLGNILKEEYVKTMPIISTRHWGMTNEKNLMKLSKGMKWNEMPYNLLDGGSGASMRSSCIGLIYHGENNRESHPST